MDSERPNCRLLKKAERTVFLHDTQEFDDDLGAGTDEDLALAGFLGVVDGIERIIEDTCLDHDDDCVSLRFSTRQREVRYLHQEEVIHISFSFISAKNVLSCQGFLWLKFSIRRRGYSPISKDASMTLQKATVPLTSDQRTS